MAESSNQPFLALNPEISDQEWQFVDELIQDLENEERQEKLLSAFFFWKNVIRAFRRVEIRRMRRTEPTAKDLRYHSLCLSALITIGEALAMDIGEMKDREVLEKEGVTRENVDATLETLKANWAEWHSEVLPERIETLRARIFDGQA